MRILYVEDDPNDADLTTHWLTQNAPHFFIHTVSTLSDATSLLTGPEAPAFDLILTDLQLPDGSGLELLSYVRQRCMPLSVVVITAVGDEETAVKALKEGAEDYIVRREDFLERLSLTLESALNRFRAKVARRARPLRVLYGEHNASDIDSTERHLSHHSQHIQIDYKRSGAEVLSSLDGPLVYDVILLNYRLPGLNAFETLKELRQKYGLDTPVILVTSRGDEDIAIQALRLGAAGYVVKNPGYLHSLEGEIENVFYRSELLRERAAFRESQEQLARTETFSKVMVTHAGLDGRWLKVPPTLCELLGYSEEELLSSYFKDVTHPEDFEADWSRCQKLIKGESRSFELEKRYIKKDGEIIWVYINCSIVTDSVGRPIHFLTYIQDINSRKKAEAALKESEVRNQAILRAIPDLIFLNNKEGVYLDYYARDLNELLVPPEQFLGKTVREVLPKPLSDAFYECFRRAESSEEPEVYEYTLGVQGDEAHYEARIVPCGEGRLLSIVRNITPRRIAEARLAESQRRYRLATAAGGVGVWDYNPLTREMFVDPQLKAALGYSEAEVRDQIDAWWELIYPDDRPKILRQVELLLTGKSDLYEVEHRLIARDGSIRWFLAKGTAILGNNGNVERMLGTATDITEPKQAEAELRASEERFAKVFRSNPQPMSITTIKDGRYIDANESFLEMSGFSRHEVIGKTVYELNNWQSPQGYDEFIEMLLANGLVRNLETSFFNKTRQVRVLLTSAELIELKGETCALIASSDITERNHALLALKQSEERFATAFRASPYPLAIGRLNSGQIIEVNHSWEALFGYSRDEVVGKRSDELGLYSDPEDRNRIRAELRRNGELRDWEVTYRLRDGRNRHALLSAERLELDGEKCVLTIVRDVTETRLALEALRASEQRFRTLVTDLQVGMLVQGSNAEILVCNNAALEMLGFSEPQLIGKTSLDSDWDVIREDGRPFHGKDHPVPQAIATQLPVRNVVMGVYRPKTDDRVWLLVDALPQFSAEGELTQVICTFTDISERKHAEEELRKSDARFRIALEAGLMGAWEWDPAANELKWSKEYFKILGFEPFSFVPTIEAWLEQVHPDDRTYAYETLSRAVESSDEYRSEYRVIWSDESIHWIEARGRRVEMDGHTSLKLNGVIADITDRKRAEESLRESHEEIQELAGRLISAQEEERRRLARELHDDLNQKIAALSIRMSLVKQRLSPRNGAVSSEIEGIQGLVSELADDIRHLSHELHPSALEHAGLPAALQSFTSEMRRLENLEIKLTVGEHCEVLPAPIAIGLFRVVQESIRNIVKHSGTDHAEIDVKRDKDMVTLKVIDRGRGFNLTFSRHNGGLGLISIEERVRLLDGTLEINSVPGRGTSITVRVPLQD